MLPLAIHHVGIAVADLDAAIATYETRLGLSVVVRELLVDQGVEAAALGVGPSQVELIQPTTAESGVARFLERRGPGLHHVAYAVPDLVAALKALADGGAELLDREPRRGLGGHLVAFVHPRSLDGVLTELVEDHHEGPGDAHGVASH